VLSNGRFIFQSKLRHQCISVGSELGHGHVYSKKSTGERMHPWGATVFKYFIR